MTLTATPPLIHYVGDGKQTTFSFDFAALEPEYIKVSIDGVAQHDGYRLDLDQDGGRVTFDTAPTAGNHVTLRRVVPVVRQTDFQQSSLLRAEALDRELDYLVAIAQQLTSEVSRLLRTAPSGNVDLTLPPVRGGGLLGYNDAGTGLTLYDADSFRGETGAQGPQGEMSGSNNLAEITNPAEARRNLGFGHEGDLIGETDLRANAVITEKLANDAVNMDKIAPALRQEIARQELPGLLCKRLMNVWQPAAVNAWANYFVMQDGSVRVAGGNTYHEQALGGNEFSQYLPGHVPLPAELVGVPDHVAAAVYQTAILTDHGDICMWGYNNYGQLGDGSTSTRNTPSLISPVIGPRSSDPGKRVVKLLHTGTAHDSHNAWFALCADRTLWAWGYNGYGQLAIGSSANHSTPQPMKRSGGQIIDDAIDLIAAGGRYGHVLVITAAGEVLACGRSNNYQTGLSSTNNAVFLTPVVGFGGEGVKKIQAGGGEGYGVSGVLSVDGKLFLAGYNGQGALGQCNTQTYPTFVPVTLDSPINDFWIVGGQYPSVFASLSDGRLLAWGANGAGQLGIGQNTNCHTPTPVTGNLGDTPHVTHISSGGTYDSSTWYQTTMAMSGDKRIFCTGCYAYSGGDYGNSFVFRPWLTPSKTVQFEHITCAQTTSEAAQFALASNGHVYVAGRNTQGKLGVGHASYLATPQRVWF